MVKYKSRMTVVYCTNSAREERNMFEKIGICVLLLIVAAPACLSYSAVVDSLGTYAVSKCALTMLTLN